ncbi:MAG: PQQ-binding-like beta-propeller repeat protein [Tepidisphaeraceae bacterium]
MYGKAKTRHPQTKFAAVAAMLVASVGLLRSVVIAEDETVVPAGQYRLCVVEIDKGIKGARSPDDIPSTLYLGFRDQRCTSVFVQSSKWAGAGPSTTWYQTATSQLILQGDRLTGSLKVLLFSYRLAVRDELSLVFDGRTGDGRITGRYSGTARNSVTGWKEQAVSGELRGSVRTEAQLQRAHVLAAGKDWPSWHGPTHNFAALPSGSKLVDSFDQARLLWRSEERTPAGPGSCGCPLGAGLQGKRSNGGGASPVVADGLVVLNYHVGSGEVADRDFVDPKREAPRAEDPNMRPEHIRDCFLVDADDVLLAMDAATGQTVWKTVFKGKGLHWPIHKTGPGNFSACISGGRVFAVGSAGRLYCLDVKSGKPLWESELGGFFKDAQQKKAQGLKDQKCIHYGRDGGWSPIVADGVVVSYDHSGGLLGFDVTSGKQLWRVAGAGSSNVTPLRWVHGGKEYVLSHGGSSHALDQVLCIEAKSGQVVWKQPVPRLQAVGGLSIGGDVLVVSREHESKKGAMGPDDPIMVIEAFKLTADGCRSLWTVDTQGKHSYYCTPAIADGKVFLSGCFDGDTWCVDLNTGKELARCKGPSAANSGMIFFGDGRLFVRPDGKHGRSAFAMYELGAEGLKSLGIPWTPPHPNTTSYHTPMSYPYVDGRLFVRGDDGIYCYDLRKASSR